MKRLALFVVATMLGSAALLAEPSPTRAEHGGLGHLPLLGGAWDHTNITVKIKAGGAIDSTVVAAVEAAIQDWNTAVNSSGGATSDFNFVIFGAADHGKADISITLRGGTNPVLGVVGQTVPNIQNGRIRSANIQISGAALGSPFSATLVGNIARHEFGHALGLGHTDFSDSTFSDGWFGDLMQSVLPSDGATQEIPVSACDVDGFAAAHAWYTGAGSTFSAPAVTSVDC